MTQFPFMSNPAFEKMNDDARKSVTQAFESMSTWRDQMSDMGEKNTGAMFDKMAEAAKALGWPTEFVEMSRNQVQTASKMQMTMVDQVMDTWQQQVEAFGKANAKAPTMPSMPQWPGMSMPSMSASAFPGFGDMSANPMQMWMQAAEMWQKNWQTAMTGWMSAQSDMMSGKGPGPNGGAKR
jgi:hypothetical protein